MESPGATLMHCFRGIGAAAAPSAVVGALAFGLSPAAAQEPQDAATIRRLLADWTAAFNERRTESVCDIYAETLVATVRGQPDRGREAVCAQLLHAVSDPATTMTYTPDIEEIIVENDLAVVRLTWTLRVQRGVVDTTIEEPGMDIFRRQPDGSWKIIRFMTYTSAESG